MENIRNYIELALLIGLTIMQLGRWSQKTEDGPSDALRIAKEAKEKADKVDSDLRSHKHAYQNFLNTQYHELDRIYSRKREVQLEFINVRDKQDSDCDRITDVEKTVAKLLGV